jgi:hypothetical protein
MKMAPIVYNKGQSRIGKVEAFGDISDDYIYRGRW